MCLLNFRQANLVLYFEFLFSKSWYFETHLIFWALFFEFEYWYGLCFFYQCFHKKRTPDTCGEYVEDIEITLSKNQQLRKLPRSKSFK